MICHFLNFFNGLIEKKKNQKTKQRSWDLNSETDLEILRLKILSEDYWPEVVGKGYCLLCLTYQKTSSPLTIISLLIMCHYHLSGRQPRCSPWVLLEPYIFIHAEAHQCSFTPSIQEPSLFVWGWPTGGRNALPVGTKNKNCLGIDLPLLMSELQKYKDFNSSVSLSHVTALRCIHKVSWSSLHEWIKVLHSWSTSFPTWPHFPTALPVFLETLPYKSLSHKSLFQDLFLENPVDSSWYQKWCWRLSLRVGF